jgi:hypothetical protein
MFQVGQHHARGRADQPTPEDPHFLPIGGYRTGAEPNFALTAF